MKLDLRQDGKSEHPSKYRLRHRAAATGPAKELSEGAAEQALKANSANSGSGVKLPTRKPLPPTITVRAFNPDGCTLSDINRALCLATLYVRFLSSSRNLCSLTSPSLAPTRNCNPSWHCTPSPTTLHSLRPSPDTLAPTLPPRAHPRSSSASRAAQRAKSDGPGSGHSRPTSAKATPHKTASS
jgi:hypothetical protein